MAVEVFRAQSERDMGGRDMGGPSSADERIDPGRVRGARDEANRSLG